MTSQKLTSHFCVIPNKQVLYRCSIGTLLVAVCYLSLYLNCLGSEMIDRERRINEILSLEPSEQAEVLEQLFQNGQSILSRLAIENQTGISWEVLINNLESDAEFRKLPFKKQIDLKIWITIFRFYRVDLRSLFPNNALIQYFYPNKNRWIKIDNGFVTKSQGSMWVHCKKQFLFSHPEKSIHLESGYEIPAFELYKLSKEYLNLADGTNNVIYFRNSFTGQTSSKIVIRLSDKEKNQSDKTIKALFKTCRQFGLSAYFQLNENRYALVFKDTLQIYQQIINNGGLLAPEFEGLVSILQKTDFYPSPNGLRVILALSEQESGSSWNPRLPYRKKVYLKHIYRDFEKNIDSRIWGTFANWILPDEFHQQKNGLLEQFKFIIDPLNKDVTEFDYYLWRKSVLATLENSKIKQSGISNIAFWLFDIGKVERRLKFELQTYGPWQINLNYFQPYLLKISDDLANYPEISKIGNEQFSINQAMLIRSINGRSDAPLDRKKVLELLINFYFKPRYQMHVLGDPDDLLFFVAEHLAGKLSTYKTALQKALNDQLGSDLRLDGDLVNYKPYSLVIDWNNISQTRKQLNFFIEKNEELFKQPIDSDKLIKILCQAETWQELQSSELYLNIMRRQVKKRIYPTTRINLYWQYPQKFARKVFNQALKIK